jgi:hypothetical protein
MSKTVYDYLVPDKGAFWELIGGGEPEAPLAAPGVQAIAHLDSALCQLTGDLEYPVIFRNPKKKALHKIHTTRIIHLVDMPSSNEAMNNIGFSAVSRVASYSDVLLKLARYKNEQLDDLPPAGFLALNNIAPKRWDQVKNNYERSRRKRGQTYWANIIELIGLDPSNPVSAEFISFAQLPQNFDEIRSTNLYIQIVALAFGVDVREFWPQSTGPLGSGRETLVQHQKAKGKGVGDILSTLERAINFKVLPPAVRFYFDFLDDDEDEQRAKIEDLKLESIMRMWIPPNTPAEVESGVVSPVSYDELRQMLADHSTYFNPEFLISDLTDEIIQHEASTRHQKARRTAKYLGPHIRMKSTGEVKKGPKTQAFRRQTGAAMNEILTRLEKDYQNGAITLDQLIEFRLGTAIEERWLD